MADAFRGLTLRLGADARPLQSAINSVTRSAAEAQKQMNRLDKALHFDSTNVKMMASKLDLVHDKAQLTARAAAKIMTSMGQAVAETKGFDLRKLANDTKEVHAKTEKLRSEYNMVDAELQKIYDAMAKVVIKSKGLADNDAVLTKVAMRMKNLSKNDAVEYIKQLRVQMKGTGDAAKKAAAEFDALVKGAKVGDATEYVKQLRQNSKGVSKEAKQAAKAFETLADEASGLKEIKSVFKVTENEGKALVKIVDQLVTRHKFLNDEFEKFSKVQSFRTAKLQMQAYVSEVRQAASESARLATEMHSFGTTGKISKAVIEVERLDRATERAVADAHKMIEAYRVEPRSLSAAAAKMRATATAQATLTAKMNALKAALKKVENDPAFDKLAASSKDAYIQAERVEQKYTRIATTLHIVDARAEELRTDLNGLDDAGKGSSEEYKKLAERLAKAEAKASELRGKLATMNDEHSAAALTMQYKKLEAQLAETRTQAAALKTQLSMLRTLANVGKSFREFGFGMYASLTPLITMAGRYALQAAEDTDKAYRDMRKTVNGTEEDFQHLLDAALEFSTTHVTTAETMLEIEALGGQLGIQVENLEAFARTVSNLDIATNMNSEEIAADLGKMATVLGMTVDDYDNFGDALVRLGNNMPAFEGDIMKITTRFMGMGKIVGMQPDQMLAWATAATATGQKAEAAGSSMLRFISYMESAVNGDALQDWADVAGMTGEAFKEAFEKDASGAMYKFIEGLGNMHNAGESVNQELKKLGINNVRDKQLLEGFAQQMANATEESNVLRQSLEMSNAAWNGEAYFIGGKWELAGDAMREAERKSEGFSGSMQKMRNQATLLANVLAEGAAPIVQDLGKSFGDLANYAKGLPDNLKTMFVGFAGILASLGPVTVGLGTFLMSLERINAAKNSVQGTFVNMAAALNNMTVNTERGMKANLRFQKVLGALGSNLGMFGIAAAAVAIQHIVGAIQDAIRKANEYKKATEDFDEAVVDTIPSLKAHGEKIKVVGNTLTISAKSAEELTSSQAKMADEIQDTNKTASSQIARLNAAKKVLDEYLGKSNLSAREQGKFKAAVDAVNEICGTQYKVLDAVNGKLADENGNLMNNVGAIDKYIAEKKKQIRVDALSSGLSKMYEQDYDLLSKLTAGYSKLAEFEQEHASEIANGTLSEGDAAQYAILKNEVQATEELYKSNNEAMKEYEAQLGSVMTTQEDTAKSLDSMMTSNSAFTSAFVGNEEQFEKAKAQLQEFGITTKEFESIDDKTWAEILAKWSSSGRKLGDILQEFGLESKTAAQVFGQEMKSAGDKFKPVADAMGKTKDEAADALNAAGISAYQLAETGSQAFIDLYNTSDGKLKLVAAKIEALNKAGIDPMKLHVEDGELVSAKGEVIDFNHLKIGDKYFKVTAKGLKELVDETAKLNEDAEEETEYTVTSEDEQLDDTLEKEEEVKEKADEGANMTINVSDEKLKDLLGEMLSDTEMSINANINFSGSGAEEVSSTWAALKESVEGGVQGTIDVDGTSIDEANTKFGDLEKAASDCCDDDYKIAIVVTGAALSEINKIQNALDSMTKYKEIIINTKHITSKGKSEDKTATGAIFNGRRIPLNASGAINGIVNRATLTNIGWVGEAGAEAVMHMRNAGGAVIPLSNRRYVRPFARAVASEMGGANNSKNINVTVNLDYNAGEDGTDIAFELADRLGALISLEA